jgi:hypothetical protein
MARRCLIIANQHYQDPDFAELSGATEDALALATGDSHVRELGVSLHSDNCR